MVLLRFKRLAAWRKEAHRPSWTSRRRRLEFVHRGSAPAVLVGEKRFRRAEFRSQRIAL